MDLITHTPRQLMKSELQFASFYLGDLLLGISIDQVREINRILRMTPVPHVAQAIRGVINLRGEVVTVVDLRTVLGLPGAEVTRESRNVIVNSGTEQIGLLVDRVADVVLANSEDIDPRPENMNGVDGRFFQGVFKLDRGLLVILDVPQALAAVGGDAVCAR